MVEVTKIFLIGFSYKMKQILKLIVKFQTCYEN